MPFSISVEYATHFSFSSEVRESGTLYIFYCICMSYHKNGSEGNNRVYNIDGRLTEFSLVETVVACYAKAHLARQPIFLFRAMYERRLWVKKIA